MATEFKKPNHYEIKDLIERASSQLASLDQKAKDLNHKVGILSLAVKKEYQYGFSVDFVSAYLIDAKDLVCNKHNDWSFSVKRFIADHENHSNHDIEDLTNGVFMMLNAMKLKLDLANSLIKDAQASLLKNRRRHFSLTDNWYEVGRMFETGDAVIDHKNRQIYGLILQSIKNGDLSKRAAAGIPGELGHPVRQPEETPERYIRRLQCIPLEEQSHIVTSLQVLSSGDGEEIIAARVEPRGDYSAAKIEEMMAEGFFLGYRGTCTEATLDGWIFVENFNLISFDILPPWR